MSSFTLFKNMIHSLLIGGLYGVAAFAADTGSFSRNSSSIVRGGNRNPQPANNREVWQPKVGQPFQIILSSSVVLQNGKGQSRTPLPGLTPQAAQIMFQLVPERVDVFDIDLWANSAETVKKLHASGKRVICYFSAGTSEDWRVEFKNIRPHDMGVNLPLWKGERWLDIRQRSVWNVMQKLSLLVNAVVMPLILIILVGVSSAHQE